MGEVCVRVAVRVRPLLPREVLRKHKVSVRAVPDSPQVAVVPDKLFSFDHAFGPEAGQDEVYESCVRPLVRHLVDGRNATVFCYGQTGSGKTFTLGGCNVDDEGGIIDRVAKDVFILLGEKMQSSGGAGVTVQVSYMELHNEKLRDLLELQTANKELPIREDENGNTVVVGAREMVVTSAQELLTVLETGNALRHIGATKMNEHSSRSHTIFTIQLVRPCHNNEPHLKSARFSKLCLVDLAGSERVGKTGIAAMHLKESSYINTGLLALGNVIRALSDPNRFRRGCVNPYIPFRDSKITRLLRDSLGGTAHTLMVACVSPSDQSLHESLTVLQFASKARHILIHPEETSSPREMRSGPPTLDPREVRLGEQEFKVKTLHLNRKAALTEEKRLKEHNDELRRALKQAEKLYEETKERSRIQAEQLVEQQILISRLQSELTTFRSASLGAAVKAGASGNSDKRPHSVPLMRHSCGQRPPKRIHSSPPAYSLGRVMAAFKMRGHLLQAEIEEKAEVSCPFIKQQAESKDRDQERKVEEEEEEEEVITGGNCFRRSLNRTWTSRQKKSAVEEGTSLQEQHGATGAEDNCITQSQTRRARLRASVTQRRIHDLSINMRIKEELIKELDKTDKEAKAVDKHGWHSADGGEGNILAKLSMQRQQIQAEVFHSLEHMRLQRAELQSSLSQLREASDDTEELNGNWEPRGEDLNHQEESMKKLSGNSWLEEEEEQVLQRGAQLQELEEELRRREEVLVHREACLQQKNKLETKMLHSSQDLNRDLLHVSVQLESVEEQLQSSVRPSGGVTIEELEKERDELRKRRDSLDAQLTDNRVLTVEEENSLLQLEEAIEALDAALEFKNHCIRDKQKSLFTTDSSSHQSHNCEPAQLCDVIRKLKLLSAPEASELLVKYFNKVVCLREAERHLRLRCEELELNAVEQEAVVLELELAVQRLALDADRRLNQQHQDHQHNIQLLLQKLKESVSGEAQQATHERLQHLEKDLFFYKSTSRELKRKLRELHAGAQHPVEQPSHTPEHRQTHTSSKGQRQHTEEAQARTHIVPTYTKIQAEQADQAHVKKSSLSTLRPSSSSDLLAHKKKEANEYSHMHTQSQGNTEGVACRAEMAPVRVCRRDLRQISPADVQARSSATRRSQSVVGTSTESLLEDSIEVSRNSDR